MDSGDSPRLRAAMVLVAAVLIFMVFYLLLRHPTVTFSGDTEPSPLSGTCSSVLDTALGNRGTISGEGRGWHYSYQVEVDGLYRVSSRSEMLAEIDCGRTRSRDAVLSAVLMSPAIVLLWFLLFGYRDRQAIADLDEQLRGLRRRLDKSPHHQ